MDSNAKQLGVVVPSAQNQAPVQVQTRMQPEPLIPLIAQTGSAVAIILALAFLIRALAALIQAAQD